MAPLLRLKATDGKAQKSPGAWARRGLDGLVAKLCTRRRPLSPCVRTNIETKIFRAKNGDFCFNQK
jgi:hypothetical protein